MEILELLKNGTADEIREVGEHLIALADGPRDRATIAMIEAGFGRFRSSKDDRIIEHLERNRQRRQSVLDALHNDGMSHSALVVEELKRRGDNPDVHAYLLELTGLQWVIESDLKLNEAQD